MIRVEELKAKYTDIRIAPAEGEAEGCCVGGALCLEIGWKTNYPVGAGLARCLKQVNPLLTNYKMGHFALGIIAENDNGNFDKAWELLDQALKFEE